MSQLLSASTVYRAGADTPPPECQAAISPGNQGEFNGISVRQIDDDTARNGRETKVYDAERWPAPSSARKRKAQLPAADPDAAPAGGKQPKDTQHADGPSTARSRAPSDEPQDAHAQPSVATQDPALAAARERCEALCAKARELLARTHAAGELPRVSDWERAVAAQVAAIDAELGTLEQAAPAANAKALGRELARAKDSLADAVAAAGRGKFERSQLAAEVFAPFLAEHLRSGDTGRIDAAAWVLKTRLGRGPLSTGLRDVLLHCLGQQAQVTATGGASGQALTLGCMLLLIRFGEGAEPRVFAQAVIEQGLRNMDGAAAGGPARVTAGTTVDQAVVTAQATTIRATATACTTLVQAAAFFLMQTDNSDPTLAHFWRCVVPAAGTFAPGDARSALEDDDFAAMAMQVTRQFGGPTLPQGRCELLLNPIFSLSTAMPERARRMLTGVLTSLRNPLLSQRWKNSLIGMVVASPQLAPTARGQMTRMLAVMDLSGDDAAVRPSALGARAVWDAARNMPPRQLGRLVEGLVNMDTTSNGPTRIDDFMMGLLAERSSMTLGQQTLVMCSYAVAKGYRTGSTFKPFWSYYTAQERERFDRGMQMSAQPSRVLSDATLTSQQQLQLLTCVYQVPGVLDPRSAASEFKAILALKTRPQRQLDLLSTLFQHGSQFLELEDFRTAREFMIAKVLELQTPQTMPDSTSVVSSSSTSSSTPASLAEQEGEQDGAAVAAQYELIQPLLGLHNGLLSQMGLNFVYDTPMPAQRLASSETALKTYRKFIDGESEAIRASGLGEVMKTAVCKALQVRLQPVLAALETLASMTREARLAPALDAVQTLTSGPSSPSSSSISRSDSKGVDDAGGTVGGAS